ncbi:MAG: hypothetical protein ACM3YE_04415 [Bacteroidota bacterium]
MGCYDFFRIVGTIDHPERADLPVELRNTGKIGEHAPLEVFGDGNDIVLKNYLAGCIFSMPNCDPSPLNRGNHHSRKPKISSPRAMFFEPVESFGFFRYEGWWFSLSRDKGSEIRYEGETDLFQDIP